MQDLQDNLSLGESYCLNQQTNAPFANLFQGDQTLQLKSDADEQLLLYFSFNNAVKLHSINFTADPESDSAPKLVKLFINRANIGFSDVDDIEPVQVLDLTPEDLHPDKTTELKFVKFQQVQNLTIFIEENNGADETHMSSLKFYGIPVSGTNMDELKKVTDEG